MSTLPASLDRTIPLGALWTSFTLTLKGLLQWKRLALLVLLSLVPLIGVAVFRWVGSHNPKTPMNAGDYLQFEFYAVLVYYSSVVAPLTILLLATGMIRDEQENQTLTYLLMCPIPRWALYLSKLLAAILVGWFITIVCMAVVMFCLWNGGSHDAGTTWFSRWIALLPATALLVAANAGVFGLLSVLLKPSLIIGVIYIGLWEGFLANYPFIMRKFTSVHYFQCIVCNWIGKDYQVQEGFTRANAIDWAVMQEVRPDMQECVITLLSIFLVSTLLAMYIFTTREFRMKTPEGN